MGDNDIASTKLKGWGEDRRLLSGVCGHCNRGVAFREPPDAESRTSAVFRHRIEEDSGDNETRSHIFVMGVCPLCNDATVVYVLEEYSHGTYSRLKQEAVYPRTSPRPPLPPEVPAELAEIYHEAASVEELSPTSAAFLARRILEQTLRHTMKSKRQLVQLIDAFLEQGHVPHGLSDLMHGVRELGNIAGHPAQAEDGSWTRIDAVEAAYVLDVVAELLQHVYVRPAIQGKMKARIEAKKAGKPVPAPTSAPVVVNASAPAPRGRRLPASFEADDDDLPF